MEIGRLNKRIAFLEQRTKVDEIGNHTSKWDEYFSCWAEVTVKTSSENSDTGVSKEVQTTEFKVRMNQYTVSVSPTTHRIVFMENEYDIVSAVPSYVHNDFIVITAVMRKAGYRDGCC